MNAERAVWTIQSVIGLSELRCMIGIEPYCCIQIRLSTKNAIVEEEMPGQDAEENN